MAYVNGRGGEVAAPRTLGYSIQALSPFWGGLPASAVKGETCRRYVRERDRKPGTTRRELGVLQAALNHAHTEGLLVHPVAVMLPKADPPRDRWLTRSEVRAILREASPHLRRLIVISIYTGTRLSAVLNLCWSESLDSGSVDLERGILHRQGARERRTAKKRESVRMPAPLVRYLRRWARHGGEKVVKDGWSRNAAHKAYEDACARAGVEDATVHDLKRTAVTWAFQRGMSLEDAASFFSTRSQTLERVYRAHSPEHQTRAAEIMGRRG
ncbi:MAG: tyrosine-type recombinase/integrase [Pseudomonadota bacterium]